MTLPFPLCFLLLLISGDQFACGQSYALCFFFFFGETLCKMNVVVVCLCICECYVTCLLSFDAVSS